MYAKSSQTESDDGSHRRKEIKNLKKFKIRGNKQHLAPVFSIVPFPLPSSLLSLLLFSHPSTSDRFLRLLPLDSIQIMAHVRPGNDSSVPGGDDQALFKVKTVDGMEFRVKKKILGMFEFMKELVSTIGDKAYEVVEDKENPIGRGKYFHRHR